MPRAVITIARSTLAQCSNDEVSWINCGGYTGVGAPPRYQDIAVV